MSRISFAALLAALLTTSAFAQDGAVPLVGDLELAQAFDDQKNV